MAMKPSAKDNQETEQSAEQLQETLDGLNFEEIATRGSRRIGCRQ